MCKINKWLTLLVNPQTTLTRLLRTEQVTGQGKWSVEGGLITAPSKSRLHLHYCSWGGVKPQW